jgi:DNA-directed RNA polymerase subunit alpha
LDDDHSQSLFRLAYILDLHGEDEEAMKAYERCIHDPPTHVNALLNLAVLYDDHARYEEALELVESVVEQFPNHVKARIFLRDIQSSLTMHYDEDRERVREKHDAILDVPISDFELSVRSRNCLKQMNIHTIGDLLRVTEQKLLAYKNFGETSLNEIKAMLAQNGLRLGQALEDGGMTIGRPAPPVVSGDPNMLNRSVAELELSVRSRKCLQRLGVSTIGELTQKSEPELLSAKNFGQTSLLEIKRRLTEMGLALRGAAT